MRFPEQFIDELRDRLPVSAVVGQRVKLKRAGRELRGLSPFGKEKTPSFFVNDQKQFYHCFSSGQHGDIFNFLMATEGLTFPEAVERCAQQAGMQLPESSPEEERKAVRRKTMREAMELAAKFYQTALGQPNGAPARGYLVERGIDEETTQRFRMGYAPAGQELKRHLVAAGCDLEDIEEAGLVLATDSGYVDRFRDRLILPLMDLQGRVVAFNGRALREDQQPKYLNSPETPIFQKGAAIYSAATAREAAIKGEKIYVVEGYMDMIAAVSAGRRGTVASLGTAVTAEQLAMLWKWTDEPVLCLDGDAPGQKAAGRVVELALPLLKPGQSLRFATMPAGTDPDKLLREEGREALDAVLDAAVPMADFIWQRERADLHEASLAGSDTPEQAAAFEARLRDLVGTIEDRPTRSAYGRYFATALKGYFSKGTAAPTFSEALPSKFGRLRWSDQEQPQVDEYEWWIKGVIPKNETIAVIGPTQSGKSFETFNIAMHIALGMDYRGCRTKQGLVVYCGMEGGKGFRDRLRAYRRHHDLPLEGIPFEVLTRRADLFGPGTDDDQLIAEIKAIALDHPHELALVVIDTWSAATPGIDENASKDVGRVRARIIKIQDACGCGVLFVHHMNAAGEKARGNTSIIADIEASLLITPVFRHEGKLLVAVQDEDGRAMRRITIHKQREGEAGRHWDFVLKAVEVRKDADGDPVTSCVSIEPARAAAEQDNQRAGKRDGGPQKGTGFKLDKGETIFFKALLEAVQKRGMPPPAALGLPASIGRVVDWEDFKVAYCSKVPNDDGATEKQKERYRWRIKAALKRGRQALMGFGVIGIDKVGEGDTERHIVWATGKRVWGPDLAWPPAPRLVAASGQDPLLAPGESIEDFFEDEVPPP